MKHSKMLFFTFAIAAAAATSQAGAEVGFQIGPGWAMSGESPLQEMDFKEDFDTGFSWGAYAAGPIAGAFGWRAEFGRDRFPADADLLGAAVEGDYDLTRFMGGIRIGNFSSESRSKPYGYFTVGGVHQDFSIEFVDSNEDIGFDGNTEFGLSFGAGYNYLIGTSWGVGGDIRFSAGNFEDDTRWWWTPTGQVFFHF